MSIPHRDSPAPWKVYQAASGALLGIGDKSARGVTDYQGGFWGSGANKRANMYLVAAAPELYIMLDRILATDPDGESSLWQEARAVLAKARGEA